MLELKVKFFIILYYRKWVIAYVKCFFYGKKMHHPVTLECVSMVWDNCKLKLLKVNPSFRAPESYEKDEDFTACKKLCIFWGAHSLRVFLEYDNDNHEAPIYLGTSVFLFYPSEQT